VCSGINLVQNLEDVLCSGLGTEVPQWCPGAKPGRGSGDEVPRSWSNFGFLYA